MGTPRDLLDRVIGRKHAPKVPPFLTDPCDLVVTSGVNFTQNQRFEFPYDVVSASSPGR